MLAKLLASMTIAVVSSSAFAFSETTLNSLIRDVHAAHNWTCQGAACNSVWADQVRSINSLVTYVDNYLPQGLALLEDTGTAARRASWAICQTTQRGSYQDLIWLINAQNRGLGRLLIIQRRTSIKPYTCSKQVN